MKNSPRGATEARQRLQLLLLLAFNLLFKLLLFYNTNSFYVSEARSNYDFLAAIESGARPALFEAGYRSLLAYIGHGFKSLTGTLDAFFWFQALLATLSVYILYRICLRLGNDRSAALFAALLATIAMDYHLLTPVFYYQTFEIFFALLAAYLVLLMIDGRPLMGWAAALLVPAIIYISLFFRGTLNYFSWLLMAMALFLFIKKKSGAGARLLAAGALTVILFAALPQGQFRNKSVKSVNDFKFYGHTLYGGDGGEGTFIYKENEARYKKKLAAFMKQKRYTEYTTRVHNEFQAGEIKEFITRSPHKWLWLQVRKVAFTFGIVPIRDSLELLATGKLPLNWQWSALIVQAPYVLLLLVFIALSVLFFNGADLKDEKLVFAFLLLLYLVASTCLYGHYQERYRQVVIIVGMIPLAAFYYRRFRARSGEQAPTRRRGIILALVVALLFVHWGLQAYDVLVRSRARYQSAVSRF